MPSAGLLVRWLKPIVNSRHQDDFCFGSMLSKKSVVRLIALLGGLGCDRPALKLPDRHSH
jgi:hypothetical protein